MAEKTSIQIVPLTSVPAGHIVTVLRIDGGRKLRQRLTDMGCLPGEKITILSDEKSGPTLISIKNSRLAIGRRMADSILVKIHPSTIKKNTHIK